MILLYQMNKEQRKFTKIYDKYVESIYRFVFIKVSSSQIAEDITSEVFLKSWEKFKQKQDSIENPRAYLYRVARNRVIDFYRERGQTTIISIEQENIVLKSDEDLEKKQETETNLEKIQKALIKLNPDYQDVIILRHVDGLPIKDIAKILDKSNGATRVMLHRAMEQLRERV